MEVIWKSILGVSIRVSSDYSFVCYTDIAKWVIPGMRLSEVCTSRVSHVLKCLGVLVEEGVSMFSLRKQGLSKRIDKGKGQYYMLDSCIALVLMAYVKYDIYMALLELLIEGSGEREAYMPALEKYRMARMILNGDEPSRVKLVSVMGKLWSTDIIIRESIFMAKDKNELMSRSKTYIMKDSQEGVFKIGKSINPEERLKMFKISNLRMELYAISDNNIETVIHRELKDKNIGGEMFKLEEKDLKRLIKKHGFKLYRGHEKG